MKKLSLTEARRLWARAQSLDERMNGATSLEDVVARTGWIRTLGGAEAYLALSARREDVSVAAVHASVATRDLVVSPAVRGCIYLVPRRDATLARRIAHQLS